MKTPKDITIQPNQPDNYSEDERFKVRAFVASVFQMFPDYHNENKKDSNFSAYCRMYAKEIIAFDNASERLEKVKKLIAVQNMKGLLGNYKNSVQALAVACGDMDKLNHDYRTAYPSNQNSTGAIAMIEKQKAIPKDEQLAKDTIKQLKDLF